VCGFANNWEKFRSVNLCGIVCWRIGIRKCNCEEQLWGSMLLSS
jgi:hypothetical protein